MNLTESYFPPAQAWWSGVRPSASAVKGAFCGSVERRLIIGSIEADE
jgi:hypothetical protein